VDLAIDALELLRARLRDQSESREEITVPELVIEGRAYEVDEDGFLNDPEIWNDEVAKDFALSENVPEMTEEHWKLVRYIRDYFMQYGIAPMVRKVTRETGFSSDKMYELFPSGPAKGACKVAGLPKPAGCV
jgi:tRNA 2-thiouridine synthesizing protein E